MGIGKRTSDAMAVLHLLFSRKPCWRHSISTTYDIGGASKLPNKLSNSTRDLQPIWEKSFPLSHRRRCCCHNVDEDRSLLPDMRVIYYLKSHERGVISLPQCRLKEGWVKLAHQNPRLFPPSISKTPSIILSELNTEPADHRLLYLNQVPIMDLGEREIWALRLVIAEIKIRLSWAWLWF